MYIFSDILLNKTPLISLLPFGQCGHGASLVSLSVRHTLEIEYNVQTMIYKHEQIEETELVA